MPTPPPPPQAVTQMGATKQEDLVPCLKSLQTALQEGREQMLELVNEMQGIVAGNGDDIGLQYTCVHGTSAPPNAAITLYARQMKEVVEQTVARTITDCSSYHTCIQRLRGSNAELNKALEDQIRRGVESQNEMKLKMKLTERARIRATSEVKLKRQLERQKLEIEEGWVEREKTLRKQILLEAKHKVREQMKRQYKSNERELKVLRAEIQAAAAAQEEMLPLKRHQEVLGEKDAQINTEREESASEHSKLRRQLEDAKMQLQIMDDERAQEQMRNTVLKDEVASLEKKVKGLQARGEEKQIRTQSQCNVLRQKLEKQKSVNTEAKERMQKGEQDRATEMEQINTRVQAVLSKKERQIRRYKRELEKLQKNCEQRLTKQMELMRNETRQLVNALENPSPGPAKLEHPRKRATDSGSERRLSGEKKTTTSRSDRHTTSGKRARTGFSSASPSRSPALVRRRSLPNVSRTRAFRSPSRNSLDRQSANKGSPFASARRARSPLRLTPKRNSGFEFKDRKRSSRRRTSKSSKVRSISTDSRLSSQTDSSLNSLNLSDLSPFKHATATSAGAERLCTLTPSKTPRRSPRRAKPRSGAKRHPNRLTRGPSMVHGAR